MITSLFNNSEIRVLNKVKKRHFLFWKSLINASSHHQRFKKRAHFDAWVKVAPRTNLLKNNEEIEEKKVGITHITSP